MILKFLLAGVLIYFTFILFRNKKPLEENKAKESDAVELVKDPICETFVEKTSEFKVKFYDNVYYFCSDDCMQKFIASKKTK